MGMGLNDGNEYGYEDVSNEDFFKQAGLGHAKFEN